MLIATFGPTTGWVGKTIIFENEQFVLEGHGLIQADHVVEYDRQGHLIWPYDGMRAWVISRASEPPVAAQPRNDDEPQLLIFDTETSGLPRNWNRPASDVDNWPRLVQIAWVVCDLKLRAKHRYTTLVRPDGWVIAPGAARVHGISTERALRDGVPVASALAAFDADLWASSMVIAHNLEFDEAVMTAEFIRAGIPHHFDDAQGLCTMRGTTELCKLEPKVRGEYKWPKLSELHEICTGRPHAGAHDAAADVEAVLQCLEILKRKRILQITLVKGH